MVKNMCKLPIVECNNCYLRPINLDDTDLIVKWRNNESVRKNFIFQDPFTKEIHENWMKTKVASGEVIQYIIVEKVNDRPIGSVYFRDIDQNFRSAEYGIFIGEDDAIGKGYGKDVAIHFTQFGFEKLGLHRIQLRVIEENEIACRSYLSAGFQKEGLFHDMVYLDNRYKNVVFMAMTRK